MSKDMLGRPSVLAREEALRTLAKHFILPSLAVEELFISHAFQRVLGEDIAAPEDLPGFNRSTMDGFAVSSADTFGASEAHAAYLKVVGAVLMGSLPGASLSKGEAMKIPTGGALPQGSDAVVMLEYAQFIDEASIEVIKPVAPFENVVQVGDDIQKGQAVLARGHRLRPQDISALASLGLTHLTVYAKPNVAIISTGNEIIPAESTPSPGQIRDSNSYTLEGLILQAGCIPVKKGIIPDDVSLLHQVIAGAIKDSQCILVTGGSSVGTADYTAKVIEGFGPPGVLVHGVAVRPGKPLIIGLIKNSKDQALIPIFGLPGHPVAVNISFELFVKPILLRMTGEVTHPALEGLSPYRTIRARLARSIASNPGREDHVRVTLERRDDELWAKPIFGSSGLISTLVKAVGTVVVPVEKNGIEVGEEVDVRLF